MREFEKKNTSLSRYDLLRIVGVGGLSVALGSLKGERRENLETMPLSTAMIDFAPQIRAPGLIQDQYPDNNALIKKILGKDYVSKMRLVWEFGYDFIKNGNITEAVYNKYPKAAIIYGALGILSTHGRDVADVLRRGWNMLGMQGTPYIIPLQGIIEPKKVEFRQDFRGNFGMFTSVTSEAVINALNRALIKYPNLKVVNMSFQMGESGFYYEVNIAKVVTIRDGDEVKKTNRIIKRKDPQVKTRDAYTPGFARKNVFELLEVCKRFPNLEFFAAAGNYNDDITFIREDLQREGIWPQNLTLVAEWNDDLNQPMGEVYGADFYVQNKLADFPSGSSFSTPLVTSLISSLIHRRIPAGLTGKFVESNLSENRAYQKINWRDYDREWISAKVIDPSKFVPI